MMFPTPKQDNWTTIYMNLTVAGFASLTNTGYQLISGNSFLILPNTPTSSSQIYQYPSDLLIIGWNSTLSQYWSGMANRTVDTTFLINVDTNKLVSPWNIPASITNVNTVVSDIQNKVLSNYQTDSYVANNLDFALSDFNSNFQGTLTQFILFSIPSFLCIMVSWFHLLRCLL